MLKSSDKVDFLTPKSVRSFRWAILGRPWIGYLGVWTALVYSVMLTALLGGVAWMLLLQAGMFYYIWINHDRDFAGLRGYGDKQWVMGLYAGLFILAVGWTAMGFIFHHHPFSIIQDALATFQAFTMFSILRIVDHDDGELEQTIKAKLHKPSLRLATEQT